MKTGFDLGPVVPGHRRTSGRRVHGQAGCSPAEHRADTQSSEPRVRPGFPRLYFKPNLIRTKQVKKPFLVQLTSPNCKPLGSFATCTRDSRKLNFGEKFTNPRLPPYGRCNS